MKKRVRHHVWIQGTVTTERGRRRHRAECVCTWAGRLRWWPAAAWTDAAGHLGGILR